ncbi:uncharacterized protein LOC127723235 [Mytilus californianus]|uniref:uncharacterized protein LOC127723235 n=1 Tax=Mytilus californianus TaxID=6549 RepID=UPI0022455466|nr:uncharacterized protein LOC127723235 [Mytilus californianus]
MTAIGVFLLNIFLFVCFSGEITLARDDRESSEMDSKIDNMIHALQGICIQDNPNQTVKHLKKHTQTILNNIGFYKDIVKLNKQLKNEIKWIVKELNGPGETKRLFELLKRDAKEVCGVLPQKKPKYKDCTEIKEKSKEKLESGVYTIHLGGTISV